MARAALRLLRTGSDADDLRVPIATAMLDIYGDMLDDEALADAVGAMIPFELAELGPVLERPG
jgi:hypothetical protein